ncbi:cellulase [Dactylosporangium fulvum]|uniref:Endoglucanase n=1 Tax=Dactylosporangium fulvum TaxID=53359 RepID=A0ABY5W6E1_9ACTN|nr:glycoside hydrolase family 9 protein [Dactylosporangium fulvum]UWP85555.1 glycoside hydrolase family 9 protein [Dactylosporangium fulvum]
MAQESREQVFNGCFNDNDTAGWFAAGGAGVQMSAVDGKLRVQVPGGTSNKFDVIVGQNDIALRNGKEYTLSFTASASEPVTVGVRAQVQVDHTFPGTFENSDVNVTPSQQQHQFTFVCTLDNTDNGQLAFQFGGHPNDCTFFLDDVSLVGGDPVRPSVPDTGPRVRVNQVGYLPFGPKRATVVTDAPEPIPWRVTDSAGNRVASDSSTPRGEDPSSGQKVHTVDFSDLTQPGIGYKLSAAGEDSIPFDISDSLYDRLRSDALHFFYLQRSGIDIRADLAPGPKYVRPAGHIGVPHDPHDGVPPNQGDKDVPCQPAVCDYTLDVQGGWYDAGDHGKYVVNGGIAVYQLLSQFERAMHRTVNGAVPEALRDGGLRVPERGNGVPDILDEARWALEFLLRMQIPAGMPFAGMAHHKVHDDKWTDLPCAPHADPQRRELHPPSTAATLNLAAVAAQAARLYDRFDNAFADGCLAAARTAWTAAQAHPAMFASPEDSSGGGPYDDDNVDDEFYWAAAELFLTTGEDTYLDALRVSPYRTGDAFGTSGFDWKYVAGLGRLDLATVTGSKPLPDADRDFARASVRAAADRYLAAVRDHPYGVPLTDGEYIWGSNSVALNKLVVMATAFDLTGDTMYRDGVLEGLDYIFGRNALNQSYVTGYGEQHSKNQHSRIYAHQRDPNFPPPPPGAIAGGPNTGLQDPKARKTLVGTQKGAPLPKPQFCYLDDIMSWSTNEVAINWNAALSWVTSFAADL